MYKLLIIDDQIIEANRKTIYEFMFGQAFKIKCIDSAEETICDTLRDEYFDCVILDNNLNSGLDKETVASMITQYKYPIIMVSNVREFTFKEYLKDGVIDFISLNQYFSLREWQRNESTCVDKKEELISQALKNLHERITYDIFMARKYTGEEKNSMVICHLSDIQFCDPKIDENSIRTLFNKLEEFIINRDSQIDIIVISGDIVFSGKKKEYGIAKEAILNFQKKLERQRKNIDILFVPGNHDYNYQYYLGDEEEKSKLDDRKVGDLIKAIKEDHGETEWTASEIVSKVFDTSVTPDLFTDFEASPFFLSNFCDFAYEITKQVQYMNKKFYVTNTRFQKRGFTFVGIDNAYKYHKNIKGDKRYIYELDSDVVEDITAPLYSISVGHVDPRSLGYQKVCEVQEDRCSDEIFRSECNPKHQCEKWGDMQMFFKRVNAIIYLFGHTHCSDIEIAKDKKVLFIGAASPTGASLSEKTVNIIEIQNNQSEINVEIAVHRATAENISYIKTNKYQYNTEKSEWSIVPEE